MATVKTVSFEIPGNDGKPLRGEIRSSAPDSERPAVVVCHGFKGFKDWGFFPPTASRLANSGFHTVTFNFSGSGVGPDGETFSEPERFRTNSHSGDVYDLLTILDALRSRRLTDATPPVTRLGLLGHSRGGGAAVLVAGRRNDVDALVTWAAIGTVDRWSSADMESWRSTGELPITNARTGEVLVMGRELLDDITNHAAGDLDIPAAASRIRCPWLIVQGEEDPAVPLSDAIRLHRACPDSSKLLSLEGAGHTFGAAHPWQGETEHYRRVMDETLDWFVDRLY